jgi:hypothetical protein
MVTGRLTVALVLLKGRIRHSSLKRKSAGVRRRKKRTSNKCVFTNEVFEYVLPCSLNFLPTDVCFSEYIAIVVLLAMEK